MKFLSKALVAATMLGSIMGASAQVIVLPGPGATYCGASKEWSMAHPNVPLEVICGDHGREVGIADYFDYGFAGSKATR